MKNIMTGIVSLVLLLIFIIFFLMVFLNSEFVSDFNTDYTSGFSYAKFNAIKIGMTKYQVHQVLGNPFIVFHSYHECFAYSRKKPSRSSIPPWDDFAWISVKVCFDERDKVVSTPRHIFWN
jgi:outer membrane protein assembly factor BamE (lipoprotein component of BamABCDE complex)